MNKNTKKLTEQEAKELTDFLEIPKKRKEVSGLLGTTPANISIIYKRVKEQGLIGVKNYEKLKNIINGKAES